jgi:hypothetical protein
MAEMKQNIPKRRAAIGSLSDVPRMASEIDPFFANNSRHWAPSMSHSLFTHSLGMVHRLKTTHSIGYPDSGLACRTWEWKMSNWRRGRRHPRIADVDRMLPGFER